MKNFKNGLIHGLGFITVLSITGLAYASYTWVSQSTVTTGDTLTASAWNDMLNNQNYLKQEVETRLQNSGGYMYGNLDMSTNKVTNLGAPIASSDAATKAYADSVGASGGGGVFTVWGTTTCPSGYSTAYTGIALFPIGRSNYDGSGGGIGTVLCFNSAAPTNNHIQASAGWSAGDGSNNDRAVKSCAVCYK